MGVTADADNAHIVGEIPFVPFQRSRGERGWVGPGLCLEFGKGSNRSGAANEEGSAPDPLKAGRVLDAVPFQRHGKRINAATHVIVAEKSLNRDLPFPKVVRL